jgi:preprotein translocase subunit SecB
MTDSRVSVGHIKIRRLACMSASFRQAIGGVASPRLPADVGLNFTIQLELHDVSDDRVTAELRLVLTHDSEAGQPYDAEVSYRAEFELGGLPDSLTPRVFAERNAPAIIFPYVREAVTAMTSRGAAGPVFIPPTNLSRLVESVRTKGAPQQQDQVPVG